MILEKNNVTYLFGAGASAETIPIVNEFPAAIDSVIRKLVNIKYGDEIHQDSEFSYQEVLNELIDKFRELENETRNHMSIDTYAKKLYVLSYNKSDAYINEYKEFKSAFACLLMLFTILKDKIKIGNGISRDIFDYNKRYDAFIAGLINTSKKLPSHVNILSWNYDLEFEKGLYQYNKNDESLGLKNIQYIYNFSPSDKTNELHNNYLNEFKFCKLNGNILFDFVSKERGIEPVNNLFTQILDQELKSDKIEKTLKIILEYYFKQRNENILENTITFSWEKTPLIQNTHKIAKDIINKTDILIIVGYSFPFFNRIIDQQILKSFKEFNKIYIQDIKDYSLSIKETLISIIGDEYTDKIIPLKNLGPNSPIYIPHSL